MIMELPSPSPVVWTNSSFKPLLGGSCASKLLWACCSVERGEGQCAPPLSTQTSSCTTCMLFRHLSWYISIASYCTLACNHPSCMHKIPCPMGSLQGSVGQLTDITHHHCPAPWRQQPHWSHVCSRVMLWPTTHSTVDQILSVLSMPIFSTIPLITFQKGFVFENTALNVITKLNVLLNCPLVSVLC